MVLVAIVAVSIISGFAWFRLAWITAKMMSSALEATALGERGRNIG